MRFRVLTLLVLTAAVAAFMVAVKASGPQMSAGLSWSILSITPGNDILLISCLTSGLLLGVPVLWIANRFGATRGYLLFSILSCVSLLALIAVFSLDTEPLSDTEARDLSVDQILRIVLLSFVWVVPLSAFLGWYSTTFVDRE